jgi:NADH-quinone oxidoreductase subunit L
MSGEQDMRKMGGLRKQIPWTFATFAIGTATIAGTPFLAGYFSKDEILLHALVRERLPLFAIGLFTAALTAFYMSRLFFMTFFGHFRGDHEAKHHVHESPWSMLFPLVALAIGCFVVGRIHIPEFVHEAVRSPDEKHLLEPEWFVYAVVGTALIGILGAFYLYIVYTGVPARIAAALRPVHRFLEEKWGFDLAYDAFASRIVWGGSSSVLWKKVDAGAIDGAVNGAGTLVSMFAQASRSLQRGYARAYALVMMGGAVALLGYLLWRP